MCTYEVKTQYYQLNVTKKVDYTYFTFLDNFMFSCIQTYVSLLPSF